MLPLPAGRTAIAQAYEPAAKYVLPQVKPFKQSSCWPCCNTTASEVHHQSNANVALKFAVRDTCGMTIIFLLCWFEVRLDGCPKGGLRVSGLFASDGWHAAQNQKWNVVAAALTLKS
eukprot:3791930-Amphidinium_carterae.1